MLHDIREEVAETVVDAIRLERLAERARGAKQKLGDPGLPLELTLVHGVTVPQ